MSDPINRKFDESAAEANRALRQAAQQQRAQQQAAAQRQRAQQRGSAQEAVSEPVQRAAQTAQQPVQRSAQTAQQPVQRTAQTAQQPVQRTAQTAQQPVQYTAQTAQQPVQRTAQTAQQPVQRTAQTAQQPVQRTAQTAQQPVQRAAQTAQQPVQRTAQTAQQPMQRTAQTAQQPVQHTAQTAQQPVRRTQPVQQTQAAVQSDRRTVRTAAPQWQPDPDDYDDEDAPIRKRRDGRSGCLGGVIYFAFVLSISIILACIGWLAASDVLALNKDPIEATITLEQDTFSDKVVTLETANGSTEEDTIRCADIDYVADQLKAHGIIQYKSLFKLYCRFSHADRQIAPGTYELNTNYDYRALVKKMQVGSGAMVTTTITIPEGYNMKQIFMKLEEENVCTYKDLMKAAADFQYNYSFLDENALGDPTRLEGFLFPDTYEFYQGMQASSAINKFLVNFHDRLTAEVIDLAEKRGITLQQAVTIASMIEKEAANDEERTLISSVIYNRLDDGMPLQIDSTIMYVLEEHGDTLTTEQTKIDSPYNTYTNTGLPPTPIANPGAASISAAVKPASTNYLYYALDAESGTHQFFTSYSEFSAFVARQSYSN